MPFHPLSVLFLLLSFKIPPTLVLPADRTCDTSRTEWHGDLNHSALRTAKRSQKRINAKTVGLITSISILLSIIPNE